MTIFERITERAYQVYEKLGVTILVILCSVFFFEPLIAQSGDEKVELSVEVESAPRVGIPFKVTFNINSEARDLRMPSLDPSLRVDMGPFVSSGRSSTYSSGSGRKVTKFTTFSYMLVASKEGTFEIPASTVKVGTSTYTSKPKSFTVFSADAAGADAIDEGAGAAAGRQLVDLNKGVFITLSLSKRTMYEQEGFLATFKLYSLYDISFQNVKFPEFDGFLVHEIEQPNVIQLSSEQYNGKIYLTGILKQSFLIPQRSGELTIPAGKFDLIVNVPVKRSGNSLESFFEDFLGGSTNVEKTISSKPMKVNVKPLPTPQPEGFNGAVGDFTMDTEVPSSVVKAGESYRINVKVKGKGNIRLIDIPKPAFPNNFEEYDPQEESDISVSANGISGSKEVQYFAVPRTHGDFEIPPIEFIYFNPATGKYHTIKSKEFKLHVDQGDGTQQAAVSNYSQKQDVEVLGSDIRYIKTNKKATRMPKLNIMGYISTYLMLLAISIVLFFIFRSKRNEKSDTALYRSKRASKVAKRWLSSAAASLKKGDDDSYYEILLSGLTDYFTSKLHIPMSSWSKEYADEILKEKNAPETVRQEMINLFSDLEFSRYTHSASVHHKEELYERSATLITKIEDLKLS